MSTLKKKSLLSVVTNLMVLVSRGFVQRRPGLGQVRHETVLRGQSTSCGSAVTKKVIYILVFMSLAFAN